MYIYIITVWLITLQKEFDKREHKARNEYLQELCTMSLMLGQVFYSGK